MTNICTLLFCGCSYFIIPFSPTLSISIVSFITDWTFPYLFISTVSHFYSSLHFYSHLAILIMCSSTENPKLKANWTFQISSVPPVAYKTAFLLPIAHFPTVVPSMSIIQLQDTLPLLAKYLMTCPD